MGPKVEAAAAFAVERGRLAIICSLDEAPEALAGQAGTVISEG
jgi:carbamate kinase